MALLGGSVVTGRAHSQALAPTPSACSLPSTSGRRAIGELQGGLQIYGQRRLPARLVAPMAKRNSSSVSSNLIAVLKDEIKYERESYRREELIAQDPPSDFELKDDSGAAWFLLTKRFNGEAIMVRAYLEQKEDDFNVDEDEELEDDDEDEESAPVEFLVIIEKDGEDVLTFDCESNGEYFTINRVALNNMEELESPAPSYRGPPFHDLDDTLQQAFVDYLEERGVNAYLGEYIRVYLADKKALEYQRWLGRVRGFVSG